MRLGIDKVDMVINGISEDEMQMLESTFQKSNEQAAAADTSSNGVQSVSQVAMKKAEDDVKLAKQQNRDMREIQLLKLKRDLIKVYTKGKQSS